MKDYRVEWIDPNNPDVWTVLEVVAPSLRDGAHAALGEILHLSRDTPKNTAGLRVRADDGTETLTLIWRRGEQQ